MTKSRSRSRKNVPRTHRAGLPNRASEPARDARRLLRPIRNDTIALLQELVRTNTVAVPPEGNETRGQKVLRRFLRSAGLDVEMYDTGFLKRSRHRLVRRNRNYSGRCNLIARVPGTGRGKSLLLTGHMDTVPGGNGGWRGDPFSGRIAGGRLYGRGSFDMKGGLAAHFAVAVALKKAKVKLGGDLLCESVIDEEWAGGGGTLAGRLRGDNADACIITEGTQLQVLRATRGGHFFDIIAEGGDPSQYFSSGEVVSPATAMGRLLGWIDRWAKRRRKVPRGSAYKHFDDPAPVQVLALEANRMEPGIPWAVPLKAGARVYFQFLPHEDVPEVIAAIRESLDRFCKKDPFFSAYPPRWEDMTSPPLLGHELPETHEWTRCVVDSAWNVLGSAVRPASAPYPCDAFICQREFGIPSLLFGPAGAGAHNINEYVTTRSVLQTAEVLLTAALNWCGP